MAATDYEYFDITQPYSLPQRNWTKDNVLLYGFYVPLTMQNQFCLLL